MTTQAGKSYLMAQMLREFGEKHRGKRAVLLLSSKPEDDELIYPGAPQAQVIELDKLEGE